MGLIHDKAVTGKVAAVEAVLDDPEWKGTTLMDTDLYENTLLHIACKYSKYPTYIDSYYKMHECKTLKSIAY